jgi:hypothetical protein
MKIFKKFTCCDKTSDEINKVNFRGKLQIVEKGDGSYDSTEFISIHNPAFIAGTVQYT